jgi:hypothetical protein
VRKSTGNWWLGISWRRWKNNNNIGIKEICCEGEWNWFRWLLVLELLNFRFYYHSISRLNVICEKSEYEVSRQGLGIFFSTTASRPALGPTQLPIQLVPGALSLGVKRSVREADHSSPSSVEVKNVRSYTSIPQYASMAWCSVKGKHRDYFTFVL